MDDIGTELATLEDGQIQTHVETEAVNPDAMAIMERVTIDTQIATAKQYPRRLKAFLDRARDMATVDEETAKSCIYRRPVGRENGGAMKYCEGESIRLAEIVAASYGNIRVRAMITEVTQRHVKAVAMAHDLENNYAMAAEVVESCVDKRGQPYSERQRLVTAKAAQSKAIRDAVFRVVPKSLCRSVTLAAKDVALGKGMTLEQRRERVMEWVKNLGIGAYRVFAALDVTGIEEVTNGHLITLTGLRTAITDGDITVAEAFPEPDDGEEEKPKGIQAVKDKLVNGKGKKAKPKTNPEAKTEPEQAEASAPVWVCERNPKHIYDQPGQTGKCPQCLGQLIEQQPSDEPTDGS